jgi:hypothetical protein
MTRILTTSQRLKVGDLLRVLSTTTGSNCDIQVIEQIMDYHSYDIKPLHELKDIHLPLPKGKVKKPYYRQKERY